ncbi:MAG TPA: c-type cytochrome [Steroidobacteraceae bacterium]
MTPDLPYRLRISLVAGSTLGFALCGCGPEPAASPAEVASRAATMRPADARLAALYDHSCRACHANAQANAPLTGDRAAWKPRIKKGGPELMRNVLTGFNGMPPGGQCFTCTPGDIEALIAFMANEDKR